MNKDCVTKLKNGSLSNILKKYCTSTKTAQKFWILFIQVMLKFRFISKYIVRRERFCWAEISLSRLCFWECMHARKVLRHVLRQMNSSSTNWLIWMHRSKNSFFDFYWFNFIQRCINRIFWFFVRIPKFLS